MIPFWVNMERLYEIFVAEWLKAHLPSSVNLSIQEKVDIGNDELLSFKIDLILYESETGKPLCVLDTKYKSIGYANTRDVAQVMAYAEMKNCRGAVLVYPVPLNFPDIRSDGLIHVKGLSFLLDGDLEVAGQSFLCDLTKNGSFRFYHHEILFSPELMVQF